MSGRQTTRFFSSARGLYENERVDNVCVVVVEAVEVVQKCIGCIGGAILQIPICTGFISNGFFQPRLSVAYFQINISQNIPYPTFQKYV